jgi:hypothetical protein
MARFSGSWGPQFWSSFDADGERAALRSAGFKPIVHRVETILEDGLPHRFLLVLAPVRSSG